MSIANTIRVVLMLVALIAVVWLIRTLNAGGFDKAFDVLGLQAGGAGSPGLQAAGRPLAPGEERYNLCPTRIVGFVWFAQNQSMRQSIEEKQVGAKMHWMAYDQTKERELAYLEVEKWLTGHCQVVVRLIEAAKTEALSHKMPQVPLKIRYVDGSRKEIVEIPGNPGHFRFDGKYYESSDFAEALAELRATAQLPPLGVE